MAVFKRDKLIDISKRNDSDALVKRLETEIKELDREVSVLESELGQQVIENDKLKQQLVDTRKDLKTDTGFSEELAENQRELERLSSLIDQYELQIDYLQAEQTSHVASPSSQSDGDLGQLQEENQQLRKEIDLILTQTVDQQEKQIAILQEKLASISTDEVVDIGQVDQLTLQITEQETQLQETQELLHARETRLIELEQETHQLLKVKQDLEQTAQEDLIQIDNLKQELHRLQERETELADMLRERDEQNLSYDALQIDYEGLKTQIIAVNQTLESQGVALSEAMATIENQDAQLSQANDAYTRELASLQALLDTKLAENETIQLKYQKEIQEKNGQLSEIKERYAQLSRQKDDLVTTSEELESALANKSELISELTQKLTYVTESYTDKNMDLNAQIVNLEQALSEANTKSDAQREEIQRLSSEHAQKETELVAIQSDMLMHQETLTLRISELETIQTDLSEQNTSLSMRLTAINQQLHEEQSQTIQLQSELSELRVQHQSEIVEKQTLLSEKEQALAIEKSKLIALNQELTTLQLTYQNLQDASQLAKTKIEDEKAMADQKINRLIIELSEVNDARQHQVSLLQSIISENKILLNQLDQQVDELKLENQKLSEEKNQKIQEFQALQHKLTAANEKNRSLEAELLVKEEHNQQELSDMMLMVSRLKHDVIAEANLEIERRREEMREEERVFKSELHKEASKLLTEVADFKAKFIEPVDD
ncbi:hypothetical protein ACWN83_01630 [Pseudolactococcus plantarum]|uniref:Uncharacterized protein n=1 Tax=Pseudolactococcus plantarum TaxID=1365 RepID=A0A2A5S430_9LACT|nr:hypothetical protein [Lactococcus plantarum]PCS08224.1 hypothetical protein RU87_GL000047 [Lactococcus plantarum]HCN75394.1 hypothetical protein [Lactococcus sp.]